MPLYHVEIEGTIVVVADDEVSAMDKVQELLDGGNHRISEDLSAIFSKDIKSKDDLFDQWTPDCLPYGATDNRTIGEYLECSSS